LQITRELTEANVIRAWEHGRVLVGEKWIDGNIIVAADVILREWRPPHPSVLGVADLLPAIELEPEIILLGTGLAPSIPDVDLMAELAERSIGLEIMTTPAACRTFNVLVHERRRVVAALFTAPTSSDRA